jgi:amidophosphoribosyltransferase
MCNDLTFVEPVPVDTDPTPTPAPVPANGLRSLRTHIRARNVPNPAPLHGPEDVSITLPRKNPFGKLQEECGVFGVFGHPDAAALTQLALMALQHRGQESAGIATVDGTGGLYHHRGMGLVSEAVPGEVVERLAQGTSSIGHVRYSTTGSSTLLNAQPLVFNFQRGNLALAHNGNLTNAYELRARLELDGAIFQSSSDTEVVAHLVARAGRADLADSIREAVTTVQGAFAFCVLSDDRLFAMRDANGLRPLALGHLDGAWCVASESCAFEAIGATFVRDVEPGEIVTISGNGVETQRWTNRATRALCTFEHIYFARPDSDIDGHNVHTVRKEFGRQLWAEHPTDADIVIGVPDSSVSSAIGYAESSGITYEIGLVKNRYIGRTFIAPSQVERQKGVRIKLSAVRRVVAGKRVVMIDDSLVRGTTSGRIVRMLRDAGAAEVHVRIASPPVTHSCFYGIDTSARDQLIASRATVPEICELIGADSLGFLSERNMMAAFGVADGQPSGACNACFTGRYPTRLFGGMAKLANEGAAGGVSVEALQATVRGGGNEREPVALGAGDRGGT